jgi:Flp pilus assembly protein TadG
MAVEIVVLIPVLFMFTLFVVAGGRYVNIQADADATARDAARAASLARTQAQAQDAVAEAIKTGLQSTKSCRATGLEGAFASGLVNGQPVNGTAKVRLECRVSLSDLGLLGLKQEITFDADGHAPIDTFRRTG